MKLILIGAGPGDPDLITYKAIKVLQSAKIVLYDALVHPQILEFCSPTCILKDVGKRFNKLSCKQDDINELIVASAQEHGEVVRLKGGDSFIFGRGYEELTYAAQFGIKTEIIPGISSSYSVPALLGLPLTSRGFTESFLVVTGTTKNHQLSEDIAVAAKTNSTVVILMGISQLEQIVGTYVSIGKENHPIAIIQNGTREDQKYVQGTISTIIELVNEQQISSPAIILIGPVASLPIQDLQYRS